jgi:hypothetical protein
VTLLHGSNNTTYNTKMSLHAKAIPTPHKQTLVDLEYFVNDLRQKEHDMAIFIDENQNDRRCYRPQGHDKHFESDGGFNIDGRIDGSLKIFFENTGPSQCS